MRVTLESFLYVVVGFLAAVSGLVLAVCLLLQACMSIYLVVEPTNPILVLSYIAGSIAGVGLAFVVCKGVKAETWGVFCMLCVFLANWLSLLFPNLFAVKVDPQLDVITQSLYWIRLYSNTIAICIVPGWQLVNVARFGGVEADIERLGGEQSFDGPTGSQGYE